MAQLSFQPGRRASPHLFPALYAHSSSVTTETGGAIDLPCFTLRITKQVKIYRVLFMVYQYLFRII